MAVAKQNRNKKPWYKADEQLLLLKEGVIKTFKEQQMYKLRVVRWGQYQAIVEKRLYHFKDDLMDYVPGKSMGFNADDLMIIIQNQDRIMNILNAIRKIVKQKKEYNEKMAIEAKKLKALKLLEKTNKQLEIINSQLK